MLEFKKVTQRDFSHLRRYYEKCEYKLCEYSAGVKLMWSGYLNPSFAEEAGCLIVKNEIDGRICFDYPVALSGGDEFAALTAIENYCIENGLPLTLSVVPEAKAPILLARYPFFRLSNIRTWRDYLYDKRDLSEFPGRRYSGQRNHVNKFRKLYPTASFRPLSKGDEALVERFWHDYEAVFTKQSESAKKELKLARQMLRMTGKPCFCVGGMELDGRLLSLSLAEKCGKTLIVHIEKALYGYEGVYPVTVQEFASYFATDDIEYLNREDDAGDRGLRTSKLQYLPTELASKYRFDIENELRDLAEIPTIRTEHLKLSALTERDKTAYNALCLDDERNKWWGYDYRKDWKGEDLEDYFLAVTRQDFAHKLAVNFAVRLDGKCIGEAVLYRFDYRGGAELGCRILPEFAGYGYGTEAFAAAADWAIYSLGLARVAAKCYHENEASFKMLSSCMRKVGSDETFYYFNKEV